MKTKLYLLAFIASVTSINCEGTNSKKQMTNHRTEDSMKEKNREKNTTDIYFAGGCFWGTEHYFKQIRGVEATEVGYANGNLSLAPSYERVCKGDTNFAETVKVSYNPLVIDLPKLIDLYFKIIDPTSLNKQGNDRGTQYRTGIYYVNENDKSLIEKAIATLATQYSKPIVVEVLPLKNYYRAEEYHQAYLDKNPKGYCHISPALFEMAKEANQAPSGKQMVFKKEDKAVLRDKLTAEQYAVTQENATERPFENAYWNEFREGIYVDITTGEPLFASTDKFESGCGWPSFSKPISKKLLLEKLDKSHQMTRTEVRSKLGDAHLGHLFTDGPIEKGGLRYCINSASLRFIPKAEMETEGYGEYLPLLETKKGKK